MMTKLPKNNRQSGAVLVLALLIVSLVTTLVITASWKFGLSMARNENRFHGIQGRSYLESAEQVAAQILIADMADPNTNKKDDRWEFWASPEGMQFPTDEGWIAGQLQDAQGLFNINLLAIPKPPVIPTTPGGRPPVQFDYTVNQERFIRLLQTLRLDDDNMVDEEYAKALTEAIIDWLDGVTHPGETGSYGAEADYYDNLPIPIAISNQPMASVSELSVIKGMKPLVYQQLLPLVIALPVDVRAIVTTQGNNNQGNNNQGRNNQRNNSQRNNNSNQPAAASNASPMMNINTMPPQLLSMFNYRGDLTPMPLEEIGQVVQEVMAELNENQQNQGPVPVMQGLTNISELTNSESFKTAFSESDPDRPFSMENIGVASSYFIFNVQTQVGEQIRKSKVMLQRAGGKVVTIRRTDANF